MTNEPSNLVDIPENAPADPDQPPTEDAVNVPSADEGLAGDRWTAMLTLLLFCVASAVLFFALVEWPRYRTMLGLERMPLTDEERWLAPLSVLAKTLLLMLPGLAGAGLAVALRRPRLGAGLLFGWHGLVYLVIAVDLTVYQSAGRHLTQLVAFLSLPRHGEVIGGFGQWVWMAVRWVVLIGAGSALLAWGARVAARTVGRRSTAWMRGFLTSVGLAGFTALAILPHGMGVLWRHRVVRERIYGAMPFDFRLGGGETADAAQGDPVLARLSEGLRVMYRSKFPLIYAAKPVDDRAVVRADRLPNVIVIALESFRRDGMSPEWMPKVDAWSRRGLRLRRHYTGSIFSEAGLFGLVYGRSPLVYHAVLDAGVPPQLCETLRHSGYRCGYFTGHPKVWFRREEYLNERNFDEFVHDDTGNWNQWDRTALANLVRAANAPGKKPLFALVFLMSSHFEYQYPPEYERHLPVTREFTWETTKMSVLGPESREPLLNRYHNTLAFLDDELKRTIDALDPDRNLIIVTGDHGESFNDDGRFGHGSVFSDVVGRVPMAIVGPGVAPGELDEPTLHADVLPTVVHAVAGRSVAVAHAHGRDLLARLPARESLLLAHCDPNRDTAEALLIGGGRRVRLHLGLQAPTLQLLGLEDERARLVVEHGLDQPQVDRLLAAFEGELAALIR